LAWHLTFFMSSFSILHRHDHDRTARNRFQLAVGCSHGLATDTLVSSRNESAPYLKITAMTKVMADRVLLIAQAKVGPVNLSPA